MNNKDNIYKIACRDEMTGFNNRNFYFHMRREIALLMIRDLLNSHEGERRGIWSILFCDANNLKYVNDTLGHDAGDEGLKKIAEIINNSIRKKDKDIVRDIHDDYIQSSYEEEINIRFGGDEFIILLPNCRQEDAVLVKDRIKSNINKNITSTNGITLAIGIIDTTSLSLNINLDKDEEIITSLEKLIKLAEESMYEDKFVNIRLLPKDEQYLLINKYLLRLQSIGIDINKLEDIDLLIEYLLELKRILGNPKIKKQ